MVEVPGGGHTITCTRLALLDGRHIFLRTKWFNTSFSVTAMDFPRSWSCHVATQDVEYRASMLGISCEEFFSQAHLYLGDGISNSQYSFEALRQRTKTMRLSWTIVDMRYTKEPRVTLFLQEDNSTMDLVPEFLNVLMDTTLIVKDLLARRKINKSKKVRQLAMRFSAPNVMKTSLSQQAPTKVGMRGGLDRLVTKSEFPNSIPKFNSSPVSHEPALSLTTPMHPSSLTTPDGRVQQHKLRTPAMDRVGSSQLQLHMNGDVYDGLDRVPPPKHPPKFTARLYEDGLPSWAQPRTPIQTPSMSRPAPTVHDVEVPQNVHSTRAGDKAFLSHESRKLGLANSGGWINPRKSSSRAESRNFELSGSKRRGASQGREGVIILSDSEEEDHHNLDPQQVDPGILDDEDWLDPGIPRAMEGLPDEPDNRFRAGQLNDLMPDPWQGNIEIQNMNVSTVKGERCRSRLEFEAQTSLGCRSLSQKRKDRDDAHENRTDIFDEGKRMQSKDQVLTSRGSLSRDKIKVDAQVYVRASAAPCIKAESEYQSDQNAVWQSGDHRYRKHPSTSNTGSSQKFASSFSNGNGGHWNTWISEANIWEAQAQIGNSMTRRSDHVGNQPTKKMVTTSSPCADSEADSDHLITSPSLMKLDRNLDFPHNDSKHLQSPRETTSSPCADSEADSDHLITSPSLMKLDRNLDFPHNDSKHLQSPRETPNVNRLPSEENSCGECPEISDKGCAENPERSHTTELGTSKKKRVSSDVSELEKMKVERELIEAENDGDRDGVQEPGFEPVLEPGLHNDTEGMTGARELLQSEQREKSASIRSLDGRKVPCRKGRPPGLKAKLRLNSTKSVTQGTKTYTDGTTQSDKDPRNTNLQRVSRTSRLVRRSNHCNSRGCPTAGVDREHQKVVPDSDCYNFDDDRVKEKIKPNEVWALYHDIDTMPRYLIRVEEVSMTSTFWVKASWLQPHIASEKNERQKETLYPRSCGDFEELKETTIFDVINCFSHRMEFTTKLDKVIQVYPRKDEVWALYSKKDLDLGRSEKANQGKQNKLIGNFSTYRLMVILSNCEEERPLDVWVLQKRIGYRTLWVPRYEKGSLPTGSMECFSHRVPAYKLTLKDYPDLNNEDIWDIDAAAVPECQGKVTW